MLYDEQPTTFRQSWDQRLRWTKGFYQVAWRYAPNLIRGVGRGGQERPFLLRCIDDRGAGRAADRFSAAGESACGGGLSHPAGELAGAVLRAELLFLATNLATGYCGFSALGLITVLCEWNRIRATRAQKLGYVFTFPLFMMTYIPLAVAALRRKVEWKPIAHHSARRGAAPVCAPRRSLGALAMGKIVKNF